MPNIKSAKKRLRQSQRQRKVNLPLRTRIKTCRNSFLEALAAGDREAGRKTYSAYCSSLDKAAKSGTLAPNTATRSKTRAAAKLRMLDA